MAWMIFDIFNGEAAIVDNPNLIIEINNLKAQIGGITKGLERIDRTTKGASISRIHISNQLFETAVRVSDLVEKIEQIEKIKVREFATNDVYEVNKRIERLQGKIALLKSNSNSSEISVNFILALIAINNLFLGIVWWIYG